MARYLIGTALTLKGTVRKRQPADVFRRLLLRQKIPFSERQLDPMRDNIDAELKNEGWDHKRKMWNGSKLPSYRKRSVVQDWPVTEFIFDDQGDLNG